MAAPRERRGASARALSGTALARAARGPPRRAPPFWAPWRRRAAAGGRAEGPGRALEDRGLPGTLRAAPRSPGAAGRLPPPLWNPVSVVFVPLPSARPRIAVVRGKSAVPCVLPGSFAGREAPGAALGCWAAGVGGPAAPGRAAVRPVNG